MKRWVAMLGTALLCGCTFSSTTNRDVHMLIATGARDSSGSFWVQVGEVQDGVVPGWSKMDSTKFNGLPSPFQPETVYDLTVQESCTRAGIGELFPITRTVLKVNSIVPNTDIKYDAEYYLAMHC